MSFPASARGTNYFAEGVLRFDPAAAIGTTNVHGTNSVSAETLRSDVLRDGAPSLALDAGGQPYRICSASLIPDGADYGSELRMASYSGASWTPPAIIPGTKGFNSQLARAATDPLGRRMAVWIHGSTAGINTNSTAAEIFLRARGGGPALLVFNGSILDTST